jgi:hypothetical protein
MNEDHIDYPVIKQIVDEIERLSGGLPKLENDFPTLIQDAVDFVIDPIRTARSTIAELDNVEKTFIGLKVEHFVRDYLGVPKGLRDLKIGGRDVDVKNTVLRTWMIPPETFKNQEPCALVMITSPSNTCSLGVFVARPEYLNADNRDKKRSVSAKAFSNIWWILRDKDLPESRFKGIDMARFRELRSMKYGNRRLAQFLRENLNRVFHRNVLLGLLHDQLDPMKRLRGNGGVRDVLAKEGIAVFSGAYDIEMIKKFAAPHCSRDEFVASMIGKEEALRISAKAKRA